MTRRWIPLLTAVLLALPLAGCSGVDDRNDANSAPAPAQSEAIATTSPGLQVGGDGSGASPSASASGQAAETAGAGGTPTAKPDADAALLGAAREVAGALRDRDLKRLSSWIDPAQGLRFSPYAHIDADNAKAWLPDQLPSFKDESKLTWGQYDGSGEPIELSFRDYFEKFVYDQDFADAPDVTANRLLGQGNVEFNGPDVYPDASFVEYHYPGFDSKLEGHDWESLILVFRPNGPDWRLCAIAHNQWTI